MRILSADSAPRQEVQPSQLREAAGCFGTGVTIVSSGGPNDFHATTVNAFSSLSLDPPLVLISLAKSSRMHEVIRGNGRFVVNILSAAQRPLANICALKEKDLSGIQTSMTEGGARYLTDNLSTIACTVYSQHDGGDHSIFIGQVDEIEMGSEAEPLLFFRGKYGTFEESNA